MFNVIIEKENTKVSLCKTTQDGLKGTVKIKKILISFDDNEFMINIQIKFSFREFHLCHFTDAINKAFLTPLINYLNSIADDEIVIDFSSKKFTNPNNTDIFSNSNERVFLFKEFLGQYFILEIILNLSSSGYNVTIKNFFIVPTAFDNVEYANSSLNGNAILSTHFQRWANEEILGFILDLQTKLVSNTIDEDLFIDSIINSKTYIEDNKFMLFIDFFIYCIKREYKGFYLHPSVVDRLMSYDLSYMELLGFVQVSGDKRSFYTFNDISFTIRNISFQIKPTDFMIQNEIYKVEIKQFNKVKNGLYTIKVPNLFPSYLFLVTSGNINSRICLSNSNEIISTHLIGIIPTEKMQNNFLAIEQNIIEEFELNDNTELMFMDSFGRLIKFKECLVYF